MKNLFVLLIMCILFIFACSKSDDVVKLEKDTPAYELAMELSNILPSLDPDKNLILVTANNFKVSSGEVIQTLITRSGSRMEQLKTMPAERLKMIIEQSIKNIAEQKLLLNAANEANIITPQAEVDSVMNLQYQRFGGKLKFKEFILNKQMTLEDVEKDIKTNLTINNYLDKILSEQVQNSDEEIQQAYQEDKTATVRHILLMTQGKSDSAKNEIHKKMEDILVQAKGGADFAELAKKYTEDPGSKDKGGLYEDFSRGKMVKPFEDAAFSVPIGEISDIIETRYGYHILKVIDRKKETRPLEEVRKELETKLTQQKKNELYADHLAKLKEQVGYEMIEL